MTTQFPSMQYNVGQNDINCTYEISNKMNNNSDIVNTYRETDDDDDDDDEDEDEDEDEHDDDDDDDDDYDDEEDEHDDERDDDKMPPLETFDLEEEIKVINVDINNQQIQSENIPSELIVDDENQDNEELPAEINESEHIHVEKVELENEEHLENTSISDEITSQSDNSKEIYRKMTLTALKTLVITKGLCTDPSKMRKPELIKMLETIIE
jgi:hypothetical protein